ncbi:MAG: acylphosphatase [Dehalococcoidia bacterium]|nr:acylphosphatase [Dehalococcoidia bacterium]
MTQKVHLSAKAYGRVQGVSFRYFVRDVAKTLGLKGYAHNLPGGDAVEVQAEGEKQQLDKLVEQLEIGPLGARVRKVEIIWTDYSGQFSDFDIRH